MTTHPFAEILDLLTVMPDGNEEAVDAVRMHDAQLTKPPGSLGRLEELVEWLARWQGKSKPSFDNPMVAIFAGNHGVTDQGVSAFPREVTAQMVANFTEGGAAISQICAQHELNLRVFELALELPTGDITRTVAMDDKMCAATIAYGMEAIAGKPDVLGIGEMGIGNTTVAAALYAALYGGSGADWVGRGTGVDDSGLKRKADAVDRALERHKSTLTDPLAILARLGGREIAAMLGAIIAGRQQHTPVIVDGFVATSAAAIAPGSTCRAAASARRTRLAMPLPTRLRTWVDRGILYPAARAGSPLSCHSLSATPVCRTTAMARISRPVSVMARRSCNASTSPRSMSLPRKSVRKSAPVKATNSAKITATAGAMWTRKSLNVSPARLPMMMFGGSPISVAAPPMLDASTSAIRYG